eukprot:TRINITY_DN3491_c0_g1_i1.p1 TRINITY_DN3491_c0_g1~~TRINITY_DN3491_c0_g1_i1.p1  ORF type:complete len:148 (-),score=27.33 TRINITY_DN3491_c0_g1_i1:266-709(-)
MFRFSTSMLAKTSRKEVTVSPYSVFLMQQASTLPKSTQSKITQKPASTKSDLSGMTFERRGKECGKVWKASSPAYRKQCKDVAAAMPKVPIVKRSSLGLSRRPPPFARWVKLNWCTAPATLSFEDKTLFLARQFHRVWKKTHTTASN